MSTQVVLPPDTTKLIAAAEAGDGASAGMLYGRAGAIVAAGFAIPEPLASFVSARLAALCTALRGPDRRDYRTALAKAAMPWAVAGRRRNTVAENARLEIAAVEVMKAEPGQVGQVLIDVANRLGVGEKTLDAAATRVRKRFPDQV